MQYATVKQMQESLGAPGWKFTNAFLIKILYLHPRNGLWQGKKYFQQKKSENLWSKFVNSRFQGHTDSHTITLTSLASNCMKLCCLGDINAI